MMQRAKTLISKDLDQLDTIDNYKFEGWQQLDQARKPQWQPMQIRSYVTAKNATKATTTVETVHRPQQE